MFEYFPNNYPWSLAVMGGAQPGRTDFRDRRSVPAAEGDRRAQERSRRAGRLVPELDEARRAGRAPRRRRHAGEPSALRRTQIPARRPLLPARRAHAEPQGSAPADRLQARHRGLRQGARRRGASRSSSSRCRMASTGCRPISCRRRSPAARPAWCISTASTSPRRSSTARSPRSTAAAASRS